MWVLGTELRSSGLVASAFTHRAVLQSPVELNVPYSVILRVFWPVFMSVYISLVLAEARKGHLISCDRVTHGCES